MRRRALIAWEIGAGRGHVVHLACIAAALQRIGYVSTAYLVYLDHASEIAPYCDAVVEGPNFPYRQPSELPQLSMHYGDWLGLHHFDEPAVVRDVVGRWRDILTEHRPDIVVAEQAPGAILAARSLHTPVVHVGVPATAPPSTMPCFPSYLPEDKTPHYSERVLTVAVNEAMAAYGLPPMAALPEIYTSDDDVVASIPLLDCYGPWRTAGLVPPVIGGKIDTDERRREEVFVYLSTTDRFEPVILAAIATLKLPTRVVLAGNPAAAVKLTQWRGAKVENQPVPPREIARSARVLVHAGNHGLSCLGLRIGIPHVTLAEQAEHIFDGQRIAEAGAGINVVRRAWTVPTIHAAIQEVWENQSFNDRAEAMATSLAPYFAGDPGDMTAERIDSVIQRCQH